MNLLRFEMFKPQKTSLEPLRVEDGLMRKHLALMGTSQLLTDVRSSHRAPRFALLKHQAACMTIQFHPPVPDDSQ